MICVIIPMMTSQTLMVDCMLLSCHAYEFQKLMVELQETFEFQKNSFILFVWTLILIHVNPWVSERWTEKTYWLLVKLTWNKNYLKIMLGTTTQKHFLSDEHITTFNHGCMWLTAQKIETFIRVPAEISMYCPQYPQSSTVSPILNERTSEWMNPWQNE